MLKTNATTIVRGDCVSIPLADNAADLVLTSPPYEDARTYGMDYRLSGDAWVAWCVPRFIECLRVSRGLVAWVVAGRTINYKWTATPALLMAALHRTGVTLRNPPIIYKRSGIPGSGGPDWLRADYEWVICATTYRGRLPWSDNTAMGHPPKCKPGGRPTHRLKDGSRSTGAYIPPKLANPGNIIDCGAVGGGNIGDKLAHENEAPFPERLAGSVILPFCPPGGLVVDPMCGSGTTLAVAIKEGRRAWGMDIRESQVELARSRVEAAEKTNHESTEELV